MTFPWDDEQADEIERIRKYGSEETARLFEKYKPRLFFTVQFRLDERLRGRVDESDILQEAHLEAVRRTDDFVNEPQVPFFIWIRQLVVQAVINTHRRHFEAQMRSVQQEVAMRQQAPLTQATSWSLAGQLQGNFTSPSGAAIRQETQKQVHEALEQMDEVDREVLTLRHLEQLNNVEVALALGLDQSATSKRYVRALQRLTKAMTG
jgi:RNA polymerase sigma-70 factor (ECF subfamily)